MPRLAEVVQRFQFSGGVDTKSDEKTVPTTKLIALENGVFTRATSIKKRNGYESIATIPDAIRMAQRGDSELLVFTDARGYSVSTAGEVSDTGAVYSAVGSDRPLVVTGTQQTMPDHATVSGITVAAWEDSRGGVWWEVLDAISGRMLTAPAQADANGQAPRCVAAGGSLHVYYSIPSAHRIMVVVVDPTNPTAAVTPALLTDDLDSANGAYDAVPTTRAGTPSVIAWFEQGSTNIRLGYVTAAGTLGTPLTGHASTFTYATASRGGASPLAVAYWNIDGGASDVIALGFVNLAATGVISTFTGGSASVLITSTSAYLAYSGTSVQRVALTITSATAAVAAFEEAAAQPSNRFVVVMPSAVPAGVAGSSVTVRSVGLASRAFARGGEAFAVFVHDTTSFNVYLTLRLAAGFVAVGRHVPANAAGAPTRRHLSSVHVDGDAFSFALPFKQRLIAESTQFTETSVRLFELDFGSERSHQYAGFGRGLYLAGTPMHYDGRIWSELGFHVGPELIVATPAGGGSMTSSTTYLYRVWYEWTDAQGEIHLGPTSAGTLVTMGGSDTQVTLTLPTLRVTGKNGVRIMVARSKAADTGDTARLFRASSLDPSTSGAVNGYVANDPTVDTVTFVDRLGDTTLATFDELYTEGGIFSNDPAPLGAAIARGKVRLLASDPSDGSIVRYSQPFDGGYGVELPPDLFTRVDPPAGNVTALSASDDREIIWTERAIYTFAGDGPAQDGSTDGGSGFSKVQLVPGDVGCTEPASVVLTPQGHMFKSAKGIYLLGNDFSLQYVGAAAEAYNGQTIRRATVLPDRTSVVFLTDSGLTLLYDYLFGQWSTFTNHEGLDAVVVNGQYHYLRTDGRIFRETIGQYSDAGQRITLALTTAWIHMLDHLQGFSKFFEMYLLGTWISSHQLGVQYQLDYMSQLSDAVWLDATGATDPAGWISGDGANTVGLEPIAGSEYGDGEYGDGLYGGTPPGEYEWRLDLYEKAHSIQFRFQDFEAATVTPGASFELTELVITGSAIANVRRPMTAGRSA